MVADALIQGSNIKDCVSLDSAKAGLLTENNVIEGSIKLLRIRYGSHTSKKGVTTK